MAVNCSPGRKRESESDDELFHYGNTMELAFGKRKSKNANIAASLSKRKRYSDSDASDDDDDDDDDDEENISDDSDSDSSHDGAAWKRNCISSDSEDDSEVKSIGLDKTDCSNKDDSDLVSPSPPPPVIPKFHTLRNEKDSKSIRDLEAALKVLKDDRLCFSPVMTVADKRRDDLVVIDDNSPAREIMVKVTCHGIISKYKMKQNEMLFHLQDKIAEKEQSTRDRILLTLGDQSIKGSDTLQSCGYTVADIIECVIVNDAMKTSLVTEKDSHKITLKIQTKEPSSKREYSLYKTDTLEKTVTAYCKERNINQKGLKIYFDGELVSMKQTPEDLDMDDCDILDLAHN